MTRLDELMNEIESHFASRGLELQRHGDGRLTSRMEVDGIVGRLVFEKQSFEDRESIGCVVALKPQPIPHELEDDVDELAELLGDGVGYDSRAKVIYGTTAIDISTERVTDELFESVLAELVNLAGRMLFKVRPVLAREMSPAAAAEVVLIDVPIDARVLPATK